jgi:hypothetical protein
MSKCQMKKYVAGGRCGGTESSSTHKDTQGVNQAFSNMLAQRDAFVNTLYKPSSNTPPLTNVNQNINSNQNSIVVKNNKPSNQLSKEEAMKIINTYSDSE